MLKRKGVNDVKLKKCKPLTFEQLKEEFETKANITFGFFKEEEKVKQTKSKIPRPVYKGKQEVKMLELKEVLVRNSKKKWKVTNCLKKRELDK